MIRNQFLLGECAISSSFPVKKKEWIELSYDGKLKVEGKTRQVNSVISGYERDAGTCYDL